MAEKETKKKKTTKKKKKKGSDGRRTLTFLITIALILFVTVIVLFNKDTIEKKIDEFNAKSKENEKLLEESTHSSTIELSKDKEASSVINEEKIKEELRKEIEKEMEENRIAEQKRREAQLAKEKREKEEAEAKLKAEAEAKEKEKEELAKANLKKRQYPLYFLQTTDESFELVKIDRIVEFNSSPLRATLDALINGLLSTEIAENSNLINTIPENTKIRSINIKEGIAYIDFNTAFTFNPFGKEGAQAALDQIVWTATAFPSVKSVQILINGKIQPYLTAEGIEISKPLTR